MQLTLLLSLALLGSPPDMRPVSSSKLPALIIGKSLQEAEKDPFLPNQNYILYERFERSGIYMREVHGFMEVGKYFFQGDEICTRIDGEKPDPCRRAFLDSKGDLWLMTKFGKGAVLRRHLFVEGW